MQFDFNKTIALIKGGLLDHEATWKSYLDENPGWQQTAMVLTGPLIIANVLLSRVFASFTGGFAAYGMHSNFFMALIMGLVMAAIGFVIAVLVFNFLAGTFGGTPNFSRAFAAVSLAAIPGWILGIVAGLIPWVGFLIALAGGIVTLVFLYKIFPMALGVPDGKRVVHFVVSLVVIIVLNMVVGFVFGRGAIQSGIQEGSYSSGAANSSVAQSGMLGAIERQGRLMDAASADVYEPPGNGKLTEDQVENYVNVLRKTRDLYEDHQEDMEKLASEMKAREEAGKTPSLSDLSAVMGGMGTAMSLNNAEMEVVKTGGGNWAEHQWIKEQLRIAAVQQGDGGDANAHNYRLYQKYKDNL